MWDELIEDYDLDTPDKGLDLQHSFFVGDAAGRTKDSTGPSDFSCSDRYESTLYCFHLVVWSDEAIYRNWAENVGITFYTPEEYFLGEKPRVFKRLLEPNDYITAEVVTTVETRELQLWVTQH